MELVNWLTSKIEKEDTDMKKIHLFLALAVGMIQPTIAVIIVAVM